MNLWNQAKAKIATLVQESHGHKVNSVALDVSLQLAGQPSLVKTLGIASQKAARVKTAAAKTVTIRKNDVVVKKAALKGAKGAVGVANEAEVKATVQENLVKIAAASLGISTEPVIQPTKSDDPSI